MRSLIDVSVSGSQSLAKPGSMPLTKIEVPDSRPAAVERFVHRRGHGVDGELQEHRSARHDVGTGAQEPLQVAERLEDPVVGHGGVDDAVGLEGQQRLGVVGGSDAQITAESGQLARVSTDLRRGGDPHADQLEVGMRVDAGDGVASDVARAPLHDSIGHVLLLSKVG